MFNLDRSGSLVSGQLDVVGDDLGHLAVLVGVDVGRNVVARRLHGNIFVFAKIDASEVLTEQLELQPVVFRRQAGEVARVALLLPARVATSASTAAASAATSVRIAPARASIPAVAPAAAAARSTTTSTATPIITANKTTQLISDPEKRFNCNATRYISLFF